MSDLFSFIIENKDFLFGGVGLFVLGALFKLFSKLIKNNKPQSNSKIPPKVNNESRNRNIKIKNSSMKAERDINIIGGDKIINKKSWEKYVD